MAEDNHEEPGVGNSGGDLPGGDERFWRELCAEMHGAREASAAELDEAESMLASIEAAELEAGKSPTPDLRLVGNAAVERAAVERAAVERGAVEPGAVEPGAVVVAPREWSSATVRRLRPSIAAAAAVLVAPKFLAAAALVTTVAATAGYFLTHTTTSLSFGEAVRILVDVRADDFARGAAQGRVAFALAENCGVLRSLDGAEPELARQADAVRQELLALLDQEPRFVMRRFDAELDDLAAAVGDRGAPTNLRLEAMASLAAQLRYGVSALRVARATLSPTLLETNDAYNRRLVRLLQ